jgi:tetratricopeptide (TPR) repeat protein
MNEGLTARFCGSWWGSEPSDRADTDERQVQTVIELDRVLPAMERRAEQAELPEERGRILSLAGDLCFDAGHRQRALHYFDRAIDTFLSAGQYGAGVAICQKVVRLTPAVIRARCTLAWMAIARGMLAEARARIRDYAEAATKLEDSRLAWGHLRMMAEVCEDQSVQETLAEALTSLGDERGAEMVEEAARTGKLRYRKLPVEKGERWSVVMERVLSPKRN